MAIYSDLRMKFLQEPGDAIVVDVAAIAEALDNITLIKKLTVPGYRAFGGTFVSLLHEPINQVTARRILNYLLISVGEFEPRVAIDYPASFVRPFPRENRYHARVEFIDPITGASEVYDRQYLGIR